MSKVMTFSIKPINYTQSYIFKQQSSVNTWIWQKSTKKSLMADNIYAYCPV